MPTSRPNDAEPLDLEAVERDLRDRRDALRARLASMAKPPERGAEIGFGKRIGEGTTEAISRLTVAPECVHCIQCARSRR